MRVHANAKLGPAGRLAVVGLIEGGCSLRTAARESSVSVATAHRWWHRWLDASEQARASRSWLEDRSSRPRRSPRQLSAEQEALILRARARTGLGPARLAGLCRRARSTIWKVLWRHGVSRRRSERPRQSFRRYEWAQPGALLHMDTKRLERFETPGHWATVQRSEKIRSRGAGHVYVHCVVDDHSRLAYAECHPADSAQAAAATLERAIAWLGELGCQPPEAVMTDNALIYRRSRIFADTLARHNAHHILTPPWTPRWNGKVERFIQTLDREWAKSQTWPSHHTRDRALSSFLRY
jgi:transposase